MSLRWIKKLYGNSDALSKHKASILSGGAFINMGEWVVHKWIVLKDPMKCLTLFKQGDYKHLAKHILRAYQVNTRHATDNCLLGGAFESSSRLHILHPPIKFVRTWAIHRSVAAATPRTKASWLGSLHSNIQSLKCFSYWKHTVNFMLHK